MSKVKYIILSLFAFGMLSTGAFAQKNISTCFLIPDKDQNQKVSIDDAISWAETMPCVVNCDDKQLYTLYSFDISIFQRKPLMTRGFGTAIEGVPISAVKFIKEAKAGDTIVLRNVICKDEEGNDVKLPMIAIELEGERTVEAESGDDKEMKE